MTPPMAASTVTSPDASPSSRVGAAGTVPVPAEEIPVPLALRRDRRGRSHGRAGWVDDPVEPEEPNEPDGPLPPVHLTLLDARRTDVPDARESDVDLFGAPVRVWLVAGKGPPERSVRALELRIAFTPNERRGLRD